MRVGVLAIKSHQLRDWIRGFSPMPGADWAEFAESMPFDDRVFVTDPNLRHFISVIQAQARAQQRGEVEEWQELKTERSAAIMNMSAIDHGEAS